jgi:hypothetical protein
MQGGREARLRKREDTCFGARKRQRSVHVDITPAVFPVILLLFSVILLVGRTPPRRLTGVQGVWWSVGARRRCCARRMRLQLLVLRLQT